MNLHRIAALVTGASRGLGASLASELARRGARVVLVARDRPALEETVSRLRAEGGDVHALVEDLADKEATHRIAGAAAALVGPIDLLIHNASTLGPTPLRLMLDTDCEDFERALAVNVLGPFRLTKAIAGSMALRGRGVVLHVTSDAAVEAYGKWGAYGASKAALDHTSRTWAAELAEVGVRFAAIDPGEMDTRMHADAIPDADRATLARPGEIARRIVDAVAAGVDRERRTRELRRDGGALVSPARWPRAEPLDDRMLVVDARASTVVGARVRDLPAYVGAHDALAMNDAATLPASLKGATATGEAIEARLVASHDSEAWGVWRAVIFGAGDWRTRTEDRPSAPDVREGDTLSFKGALSARVTRVIEPRLIELTFNGAADHFWSALYRHGRPVQYAHVAAPLALWHVQTPFASRPWASEMPSAARPLAWELLLALRAKGATFARVTHAAGLSSTGDARLDAKLPLRESFEVDADAVRAIDAAHAHGGRVIAIGTSAARAIESAAAQSDGSALTPAHGATDLLLGPSYRLRAVDAILTGVHEAGTTHASLLEAFAPRRLLDRAREIAEERGYLGHEFGDSMLVVGGGAEAGRANPQP